MLRARDGWNKYTTDQEAYRRAGGRRAYNARRRSMALYRRMRLMEIANERKLYLWKRGPQTELARELGVSRSTISRDVAAIFAMAEPGKQCPVCRCHISHTGWDALAAIGQRSLVRDS